MKDVHYACLYFKKQKLIKIVNAVTRFKCRVLKLVKHNPITIRPMERPEKQFYLLEVRGAHSIFGKNLCKQISNKLTSLSTFLSHYALKTQNNYTHFEAIFQHFF